jgi:hypothetical protein
MLDKGSESDYNRHMSESLRKSKQVITSILEEHAVIKVGRCSHAVVLPKAWVKQYGLDQKGRVAVVGDIHDLTLKIVAVYQR